MPASNLLHVCAYVHAVCTPVIPSVYCASVYDIRSLLRLSLELHCIIESLHTSNAYLFKGIWI